MSIDKEAIERGIAYLDSLEPEWREMVNLDVFDMRSAGNDVLAQVTGLEFYDAVTAATLATGDSWSDELESWSVTHGFALANDPEQDEEDVDRTWDELTRAWAEEIEHD
jgi:hypothetical protein